MPSSENIVSISILPVKNAEINCAGKPVNIGIKAFLKTCLYSISLSLSPLAFAVKTYCFFISSIKLFLVNIVITAKLPMTEDIIGNVMCQR